MRAGGSKDGRTIRRMHRHRMQDKDKDKGTVMATRRTILQATFAAGAASVFTGVLGGIGSAFAQAAASVMRKSLHDMPLGDPDLSAYREFVGFMLKQDQSKPVSWLQYSLLHGNADTGNFKFCPHGDWYFLPWHRAYVAMYENAVRAVTQKADFAMPYWDWTVDRTMPQAFTDPTYNGASNPLYVPGRTLSNPNRWPLRDPIVGSDVMKKIYSQTTYQSFGTSKNPAQNNLDMSWVVAGGGVQGTLEATPHNNIHNFIGAFMPTAGSPRDPIFMMHHGNIDRIWAYWNALGRKNSDGMSDSDWTLWSEMIFANNYMTPTGTPYSAVVKDLQSTLALGYTYDQLPQHDNLREDPERTRRMLSLFATASGAASLENLQVLSSPNRLAARTNRALVKEVGLNPNLRAMVTDDKRGASQDAEIFALIKDIQVGASVGGMRIFVNAENPTANTPDNDPHFVSEVGFFSHGDGHGNHHKALPTVLIDLTDTLRSLAKRGQLGGDRISVQLVPVLREGAKDGDAATLLPAVVEVAAL